MTAEEQFGEGRGKLLFVAPSAYVLGGVQVWLDYVLPGLRAKGWGVDLALTSGAHHDARAYLAQHPFRRAHFVEAQTGTQFSRVVALADLFKAIAPDIVVGVNIADIYAAVARTCIAERNMRAVATLHALQPDFLADFRLYGDCIDAVICTNRLAQRLVQETGDGTAPVLYAPYGVDEAPLSGDRETNGTRLRLAYVGRIENEQKRIDDLIEIVGAARTAGVDVELAVAGSGPDEAWMRQRVLERRIDDRVSFLGVLGPEEIAEKVYRQCDALIITSLWETGPIVAWEAMMHGLVVLTSAYVGSGAEGALREGENCLMFPVGDIGAAVGRLRLLREPEVRARIAREGRNLVLARYTKEKSVAQWDECLRKIIRLRPKQARTSPPIRQSGRLDLLFGVEHGEKIRRLMGRAHLHAEPGGEWPHAYGEGAMSGDAFWRLAERIDRMGAGT